MAPQLSILNETPQHLPGPELLHELIAYGSAPNRIAIEYTDDEGSCHTLTYEQLDARSDALASRILLARKPEQIRRNARFIVPLYIQQCLELYVAQIAVLKAGGAFCPVALDVPDDRLRFILKDTDASVLVTTTDHIDQLPHLQGLEIVHAKDDGGHDRPYDEPSISPTQAAYIMYTSGSTGLPKGVVISHSAATQALLAHERHIPPFQRFLQFASPTFDVCVSEIFFPLYRGATLVACHRRQLLNDLPEAINRLKIDAAELTPSVASTLLRGRQSVPGLKLLLTIGEMLKKSVVEEFATDVEECGILCGMYGPTEATIHCTVQPNFQKTMSIRNIGIPLDTVSAFIVRPIASESNAVPEVLALGEEGELALGGTQLADGYLNREEQTRAAFVSHPQYGRLYRTGDRARMDGEMRLECLGRISSGQVKLRGQRIELGEVEYAASKTTGCGSSVAEVLDGQLAVFCVRKNQSLTEVAVKQTCRKWLPKFMTPTNVLLLDVLPYLASGKVDRKALAALFTTTQHSMSSGEVDRPQRSRVADEIARAIGKVCGVAIDDSTKFPTIGIDSLSAIRIAAELRRHGHERVDATVILDSQCLRDLEQQMHQLDTNVADEESISSARLSAKIDQTLTRCENEVDYIYPCTPVQSAMLGVTGRDPQAYCNSITLEVKADATPERILAAIGDVSQAHPMLRSGFVATAKSHTGYAVVTWQSLAADQVKVVEYLEDSFTIDKAGDLLRPCHFQILRCKTEVRVLIHMHHALYDQWSMDIFRKDLSAALRCGTTASGASFEPVAAHYRSTARQSTKEADEAFWQDHLRDLTITLLPNMNAKIVSPQLQQTQWHDLGINTEGARSKALHLGCSLPAVFQSAFALMLGCYCGSTDVTFGTVFSGRHLPLPGIEEIFGPCLVTLPCRVDVAAVRTSAELLRLMHSTNRDIQRHTDLPLATITQAAGCTPGNPLFDTLFVWQETTLQTNDEVMCVKETASRDHHEFNLVLEFDPTDRLSVRATYQQSLITGEQVDVLLRQLVSYASKMLEAPNTTIANLHARLDESLLSSSNSQPTYCADPQGLVAAFEDQARQQPDAIALTFATTIQRKGMSTEDLTYGELNTRSNQLARFLRSSGVVSGDLVCICMEKSLLFYTGVLAILKAGAGYVPLTPATPSARISTILQQAGARYSLCDSNSISNFASMTSTKAVNVTEIDTMDQVTDNLQLPYAGEDIAYTVFTSGSTGEPKGVSVTHQNLNGNLVTLSDLYHAGAGDRLLQACSQAFDVAVFEIMFALTRGLCLCSASNATLFSDLELSIRHFGITHLSLTPTVAALIDPVNVPTVQFLVTAGEGVTEHVRRTWAGKCLLHQGYGPSETTNICSINIRMSELDSLGSIGPPLKNTSVYVLSPDHDFQILPLGSLGELAFGGEQVFRGYLGRDDLNATKLLNHAHFGRIYKSGDTGRILPDGSMLIAGRIDDQVKLRGNRIELGEINAAILCNEDVRDCTTLLCGDTEVDQQLVAFWVPQAAAVRHNIPILSLHESRSSTVKLLYEQLEDRVPAYMIPNLLLPVSHLPMTSQTKLDRRMLRSLLSDLSIEDRLPYARASEVRNPDEEWTTEENIIASVVSEVVQVSRNVIGKNTSFFALGVNSLNAIAIVRQLSARFNLSISISLFMRQASTRKLATALREEARSTTKNNSPSVGRVFDSAFEAQVTKDYAERGISVSAILPCTPLQDAMLSSSEARSSSSYCNTTTYRINGDMERMKHCWHRLATRHAILRTSFVRTNSSQNPFAQIVTTSADLPCIVRSNTMETLRHESDASQEISKELSLNRPFSIVLEAQTLHVHMHHALYDGVSMSIIADEIQHIYRGHDLASPGSFEPYLALVTQHSGEAAINAWSELLNGYIPKPFPEVELAEQNGDGITKVRTLRHTTADVDAYCKRYAVTPLSILQAAWAKVLSEVQDATDVCFGNVVSGRSVPVPGVERLVAPCFNTIPVRMHLAQHGSNVRLIQALHKQNLSSLECQLAPLRRLQTLSTQPQCHLFDSLLLFQPPEQALDTSIWQKIDEQGYMDLPLVVEVNPTADTYVAQLHFLRTHISDGLATNLLDAFLESFDACIRYPSGDLQDLASREPSQLTGKLTSGTSEEVQFSPATNLDHGAQREWTPDMLMVGNAFAKLANVDRRKITQHTSMYQLGLDSLNAAQIAYALRKNGLQVDAADVLQGLTPSMIAHLASVGDGPAEEESPTVDLELFDATSRQALADTGLLSAEDVQNIRPCTPSQCGMLAQSQQMHGRLYVNHVLYRLPTHTSDSQATSAWLAVQRKHQALRTGYWQTDDATTPYRALVWYPGALATRPVSAVSTSNTEEIESAASSAIMSELHRPAWQVHICSHGTDNALLLSIHHALYDAEGLQFLIADFEAALRGEQIGAEVSIDSLLLTALGPGMAKSRQSSEFWSSTLQGVIIARFPDLCPSVVSQAGLRSVDSDFVIEQNMIDDFCRTNHATIQALGQAVWAMLVAAYTGEDDVVFGTVFSTRLGAASQATAFPAISTIPVICKTTSEPLKIIAQMVEYNAAAYGHRFTPLSELQRVAGDARRALFDTVFVYQKSTAFSKTTTMPILRETASVDYAVSFELGMGKNSRFAARLTYDSSKIPAEHAHLLLAQYERMLHDLVDRPDDILERKLYSIVPARVTQLPSKATFLHDFVELSARQHPDRPALEFISMTGIGKTAKKIWTYRQLNQRANQLAHQLRNEAIVTGSIVAVRMDKCPEASISFLAILKAGCSFLALDPGLPQARQEFILQDSGAAALLVDTVSHQGSNVKGPTTILVQESRLDGFPSTNVDSGLEDTSATCYCLYTSGTTGTPKGCEISHANTIQAILAFQDLFVGHWTESSRWLQFASYWFDVGVLEHFWSWSVGITMVGAPRDMVLEDLAGFIQFNKITHIALTPSLARLVQPADVPSLHGGVFITGGEALKQEIIDSWGPYSTVCNFYGPTEATIGVTANTFLGGDAKSTNIGKPFINVGVLVLQPGSDQAVFCGAVGELCISGKLVGKGYLNRPDLTGETFQYLARYGNRIYRTGDLVRLLADGSISFVGRMDGQSKLRGQRLEVAEIDNVIKISSPSIEDALSLVIKSNDDVKQTLVSFCTSAAWGMRSKAEIDRSPAAKALVDTAMDACRGHLPAYMVPTHIIPLSAWPLTVNNKVDSKSLFALYNATIDAGNGDKESHGASKPLNGSEKLIRSTVAEMLKLDESVVQRNTNLFSLGLSSVSAITLASLLKRCGVSKASVGAIMQYPTISELAATTSDDHRGRLQSDAAQQAQLSISAFAVRHRATALRGLELSIGDIEAITPCTGLQTGLILESIRRPERPYFNEFHYRLHGVENTKLRSAIERVAVATQMLRVHFLQSDEGFVQIVSKDVNIPWHHTRVDDLAVGDTVASIRSNWLHKNQEQVVEPFRMTIVERASWTELIVHAHHAIYDGISWDLMMDALAEAYTNNSTPNCGPRFTDVLPHGPICHTTDVEQFWKQRMEEYQHQALNGPAVDATSAVTASLHIKDMAGVDQLRKHLAVSHQALLQACFEVAIQQHFREVNSYGQVLSGRSIAFEEADRVIGPLFNTLPVALSVEPKDSWASLIRRCHQSNTALLPYQHTPLRDIRKWCGWSSTESMFDILFVLQHLTKQPSGEKYGLWEAIDQPLRADYPLSFELTMMPDATLHATVVAQGGVCDHRSLEALLESFATAINAASTNPDRGIAQDFTIPTTVMDKIQAREVKPQPHLNGVQDFSWTEEALRLRSAIAEISGMREGAIDEHTSIFALGMDSIDAVKLSSRAKKSGFPLPVSRILQAQTIPRMLEAIKQGNAEAVAGSGLDAKLVEQSKLLLKAFRTEHRDAADHVENILPATPSQEALIADMLRSDFQDYYNHDVLELDSQTDLNKLRSALREVVDGSPILRTGFCEITAIDIDATFAQVIWPSSFVHIDETTMTTDLEIVLRDITKNVRRYHSSRPLLRLTVVSSESTRHLVISLAHAQYDGHSLALLHEDIQRAYDGEYTVRPSYEGDIQQALASTDESARNFWYSNLAGTRVRQWPQRAIDKPVGTVHRAERASKLTLAAIRGFCQANSTSIQALAQTCWSLLLAHHTQALEIMFGVVLACRDSEEAEQIIFPMMNTVPMRAALHGTRLEMLRAMQSTIDDMRPYQRTPLRTIQALCRDAVDGPGGRGLFDTLFIYQHRPEAGQDHKRPLYKSVGGSSSVEYPVAVEMEAVGEELLMRCACKDSVLDQASTDRLLEQLDTVLESIVNAPTQPTVSFHDGGKVSIGKLPAFALTSKATKTPAIKQKKETSAYSEISPTALAIREALAQVAKLPADSILPTATIESIGIDSISAIKVAAILRKGTIHLPVSQIIRSRTVTTMAEVVESKYQASENDDTKAEDVVANALEERGLTKSLSTPGIDMENVQTVFPATAGQVYMLSTWLRSHGQLFYPTFSYELQTSIREDQLRNAWQKLVERHDILRTIFRATSDSTIPAVQVVLKQAPESFNPYVGKPQNTDDFSQPMVALSAEPNKDGWLLKLKIHHALYDAVCLPLLMQDFASLLNSKEPIAPNIKVADFLAFFVTDAAQEKQKAFWTSYLKDVRAPALKQPNTFGREKRVELFKPGLLADTAGLERLARQEGVTIQALLFAAYAKIYASPTSAETAQADAEYDVILGIYLSNRSHLPDLNKLASPTLNLVPLRVHSPSERTIVQVAKQIQNNLQQIGTAENSAVGLWQIAEWTGVKVDTFVNFLKLPDRSEDEVGEAANGVVLRETNERKTEEYARVAELDSDAADFASPKELVELEIKDAYPYSLDLEATVANGTLDVGLFCPEEMLGLEVAQNVVVELRSLLEKLVGKAKG